MFIQGDLQAVFDALYTIGAIDPVLNADWSQINNEMMKKPQVVQHLCGSINACAGDKSMLVKTLLNMDKRSLEFVAIEVAREFSEFQDRTELH
ncbi:MAG: cytochrome [Bdellovibrionaceae bacterium]|nr:cytochrome [Pseudobdellovibrionaceae bacterium]